MCVSRKVEFGVVLQKPFVHRMNIGYAIKERYKFDGNNEKLLEELDWLKSVRDLLLDEVARRASRVDTLYKY
jgi:hypothetical protein